MEEEATAEEDMEAEADGVVKSPLLRAFNFLYFIMHN